MSEASPSESSDTHSSSGGSVVMLSGDLMFASRVRAAAAKAGLDFQISGKLPEDQTESIRYVILDLSTRSGLTAEIAGQCAERCPQAKLIAYGPHVQVEKLDGARGAGIQMVLTNGQFDRQLSQLLV